MDPRARQFGVRPSRLAGADSTDGVSRRNCSLAVPADPAMATRVDRRSVGDVSDVPTQRRGDVLRPRGFQPPFAMDPPRSSPIPSGRSESTPSSFFRRGCSVSHHRRSIVEAVFFALKQRYGGTLRARTWFGQFRELVLKAAVRNVEIAR